jgi:hypothetical protein
MREFVQSAIAALDHHDLAGTCGHPDRCVCDCCWVRLQNKQVAADVLSPEKP